MSLLDWSIVATAAAMLVVGAVVSRRYMRGIADYLAAGRSAGRYVLSLSQGTAALGAISIVGLLEMGYVAGFAMTWWGFTTNFVVLLITVSGWVIYRFRQTRALTLAEFFERRYSRRFRVFAGGLAFVSGVINFGIFPAVGARFFIHYCGLPEAVSLGGLEVGTFPLVMLVLLGTALGFVFAGGQVAVIVTDFVQGVWVNAVFVVILFYLLGTVDWTQIFSALATAPEGASLTDPFRTQHVEDFNFWYFLIGIVGVFYGTMSWQGTQAYNSSASDAHEARMGAVLNNWRILPQTTFLLFVPIVAYTVLHDATFTPIAADVQGHLVAIDNDAVRSQLRTPLVLARLLPPGLVGAFAAVMLAAFISTHDTYLHSWASILVQDVVLPLRRRAPSPEEHLRLLRWAVLAVAAFIFGFSLLFQQSEYIFLFFAVTGAIFAGGSGAVIIGGLYWSRGTTAAAWSAMAVGATVSVGGIVLQQVVPDFPINGQLFWALSMAASTAVYVAVSWLGPRQRFDLDRLLHRDGSPPPPRDLRRALGLGPEMSRGDRRTVLASHLWMGAWLAVFAVGTVASLTVGLRPDTWERFWRAYVLLHAAASAVVVVWFAVGGARDLRRMLGRLAVQERDRSDDGQVRERGPC